MSATEMPNRGHGPLVHRKKVNFTLTVMMRIATPRMMKKQ